MLQSTLCYLERGDAYLMLHRVKKEHDANRDKWILMQKNRLPGRQKALRIQILWKRIF